MSMDTCMQSGTCVHAEASGSRAFRGLRAHESEDNSGLSHLRARRPAPARRAARRDPRPRSRAAVPPGRAASAAGAAAARSVAPSAWRQEAAGDWRWLASRRLGPHANISDKGNTSRAALHDAFNQEHAGSGHRLSRNSRSASSAERTTANRTGMTWRAGAEAQRLAAPYSCTDTDAAAIHSLISCQGGVRTHLW